MLRRLLFFISLSGLLSWQWACSSPPVNDSTGGTRVKKEKPSDEDGLVFDDCKENEKESDAEGEPLFLVANHTYEGENGVKDLLTQNCVSCHQDASAGGVALDSYAKAKSNADAMLDRMRLADDDPLLMPPGDKLANAKIALLEGWIDEGKQEGAAPETTEEELEEEEADEEQTETTASDPCGGSKSSGGTSGEDLIVEGNGSEDDADDKLIKGAFDQFIKPAKRETCIDSGKIYDRELAECTLEIASIECNWTAIKEVFGNSQGIVDAQTKFDGEGFLLDQCGQTATGKLHVYLYCLAKESGGVCVSEDQLADKVFVQTRKIKQAE